MRSFASDAPIVFDGQPQRVAEVFARDGRLHADGAAIDFSYAYNVGRDADESAPSLARDVDEDPCARLGAVIILRRRGADAPRVHLRAEVDAALRECMDQALEALERDPGARAPVVGFARRWSSSTR